MGHVPYLERMVMVAIARLLQLWRLHAGEQCPYASWESRGFGGGALSSRKLPMSFMATPSAMMTAPLTQYSSSCRKLRARESHLVRRQHG